VYNGGEFLGKMIPEKYFHKFYQQPVTEVAIRSTLAQDLYIIPVDWEEGGTTVFKFIINPLVSWIWIGGAVMVFGGTIAFWPDRRRKPTAVLQTAQVAVAVGGEE
ncbi:MAG: hypothetical protein HY667_01000, partial [Chloroflexi bacterium]|nr:hypothetical protein [Chloroflexota bacterium]